MTINGDITRIGPNVDNAAQEAIAMGEPYTANITIKGSSALLFHRWNNSAVAEKAAAAKGSKAKKSDDVESYVWRDMDNIVCLPGHYLVGSITDPRNGAAKYRQDPRSPRKSALDLFRAGVVPLTELAPLRSASGSLAESWDYLDERRVTVQRAGITRVRPAFLAGWEADVQVGVLTPEYIPPMMLHDVISMAGRLVGVGDFRPTFGRFAIVKFDIGLDA